MEKSLLEYREAAETAARKAGTLLIEMLLTAKVKEKSPKDLVTDADVAAQLAIQEHFVDSVS